MLRIQRLNMDNSWKLEWNGFHIVLDPWLSGSEIDGFKAFNEQWHRTPPLPYDQLGRVDAVLVSQPYSDHCHEHTLQHLPGSYALLSVPPAVKRIQKAGLKQPVQTIPSLPEALAWNEFSVSRITPRRLLDPIYHALVIRYHDDYIFYAPHGFSLSESEVAMLKPWQCRALITTFTEFYLPFFLGGVINPGVEPALKLVQQLQPQYVLNTHDENKIARGLVSRLARVDYPRFETIQVSPSQPLWLNHYEPVTLQPA